MASNALLISLVLCCVVGSARPRAVIRNVPKILERQQNSQWFKDGLNFVEDALKMKEIRTKAKNVILFIGDGMGISTVSAARVLDGQLLGKQGEEHALSWEKFPFVGLSKTYNTDAQTPDSAGTATAFMTGVKAREGVVSVNENVIRKNCSTMKFNEVLSILELAERKGLATGVVTTARITHATPSTTYAHAADRNWEYSAPSDCKDIASQLIEFPLGDGIEVALGGGRRNFLANSTADPEYPTKMGKREDNRDLTKEWVAKSKPGNRWEYVWNKAEFDKLDPSKIDHVLGLFEYSHMRYSTDTDIAGEPSLTEMTEFAIKALRKRDNGFFLLVEGGRIDHGHHANSGYHALHDTVAMAKAVAKANELTKEEDTLIIVSADHSHVFVFGGYQKRGNPIFGLASDIGKAKDEKFFTSLGYYNGPSALVNKSRSDPVNYTDKSYLQQSLIPLGSETHGAEDVGIYARGPQAHLVRGVMEQSNIFHVMDYALCLTDQKESLCRQQGLLPSTASCLGRSFINIIMPGFVAFILSIVVH